MFPVRCAVFGESQSEHCKLNAMQRRLYIIATTSRCGSTHLCRMLTSTCRLGEPAEYYNVHVKPERMKLWHAQSDIEYFQQMLLRTSTDNGVCGVKVATDAFEKLRKELDPIFELLRPRYIWLRRRDILRQAISLYRARETDVWHWHVGQTKPQAVPPFDTDKINACQGQIEQANAAWASWFAEVQLEPLKLWYEDVNTLPRATLETICHHVGVSSSNLPPINSDLRVMRDGVTEAWIGALSGAASYRK